MISEFLGHRSLGRNLLIVAIVMFLVISVTFFLVSIGYGFIAAILGIVVAFALVIIFALQHFTKYQPMDALKAGYMNLYSGSFTFNFPHAVRLFMAKHESSTIHGFMGWATGRTIAPSDSEILTYMMPDDEKAKYKKAGVKLDDLMWAIRVKPHSKELPQEVLCIVADSQISDLSKDATGDFQIGTDLLVRGHFIRYGKFFILLNPKYSITKGAAAAETSAIMAVLSQYINRYGGLVSTDIKTKGGVIEQRAMRKKEVEAIEQN